jgi:hypothetical protein
MVPCGTSEFGTLNPGDFYHFSVAVKFKNLKLTHSMSVTELACVACCATFPRSRSNSSSDKSSIME